MKKRFVISTNNLASKDSEKTLIRIIEERGMFWWHWLPNTWLVVDPMGRTNISDLTNLINSNFPQAYFLVLEVAGTGGLWMGYGPTLTEAESKANPNKDMFYWLKTVWSPPHIY